MFPLFTSVFVQNRGRGALYAANESGQPDLVGKQKRSEKKTRHIVFPEGSHWWGSGKGEAMLSRGEMGKEQNKKYFLPRV